MVELVERHGVAVDAGLRSDGYAGVPGFRIGARYGRERYGAIGCPVRLVNLIRESGADHRGGHGLSVAGAEPSELETLTGPTIPARSVIVISLPPVPPAVAVQFVSPAAICAAIFDAMDAESGSEPWSHE